MTLALYPGVPYAEVGGQQFSLEVGFPIASSLGTVGLRVASSGVRLTGVATVQDFPLHPARAFVVEEIFVPAPGAPLKATSASAGFLHAELELASVVRPTGVRSWSLGSTVPFSGPCEQFALSPGDVETKDGLEGKSIGERLLKAGGVVPLSVDAEGPKIAELLPSELYRGVDLLAEAHGRSRIAWPVDQVVVVGWVPSGELSPVGFWCRQGANYRAFRPAGPPQRDQSLVCSREIDLIAAVGGSRRTVGEIGTGVRIVTLAERDGFFSIELPDAGITLVSGAELLVSQSDVERCTAH